MINGKPHMELFSVRPCGFVFLTGALTDLAAYTGNVERKVLDAVLLCQCAK